MLGRLPSRIERRTHNGHTRVLCLVAEADICSSHSPLLIILTRVAEQLFLRRKPCYTPSSSIAASAAALGYEFGYGLCDTCCVSRLRLLRPVVGTTSYAVCFSRLLQPTPATHGEISVQRYTRHERIRASLSLCSTPLTRADVTHERPCPQPPATCLASPKNGHTIHAVADRGFLPREHHFHHVYNEHVRVVLFVVSPFTTHLLSLALSPVVAGKYIDESKHKAPLPFMSDSLRRSGLGFGDSPVAFEARLDH